MSRSPCANCWLLVPFAILFSAAPREGVAQQFRAVLVHGDGLERPTVIDQDGVAMCLWFFTYNFFVRREGTPDGESGAVTLSFLTDDQWGTYAGQPERLGAVLSAAEFHTRLIVLRNGLAHVEYKKPRDDGFVARMQLHPSAEVFLASYGIPTRLGPLGGPALLPLRAGDVATAEANLADDLGNALPNCRKMGPNRG
jgi:hypothetical protein